MGQEGGRAQDTYNLKSFISQEVNGGSRGFGPCALEQMLATEVDRLNAPPLRGGLEVDHCPTKHGVEGRQAVQ